MIAYLENCKVFPESYSASAGWYKGEYTVQMGEQISQIVLEHLRLYYIELLSDYPDVLTTQVVSEITGYGKTSINTGAIRGTSNLSGKTMSTTFRGLFGGVLLLYLLPHYHSQITVAHPYPARLFQLAEKSVTCTQQRLKEVRSNGKFLRRAVLRKC